MKKSSLFLGVLTALTALPSLAAPPDPKYDRMYPYYMDLCGSSQYGEAATNDRGGAPGHAVLYIKGACKDQNAPYPRLTMDNCANDEGVGVSTYFGFKNVLWVATPGSFFWSAGLSQGDKIDGGTRTETVKKAIELDIFKGVDMHVNINGNTIMGERAQTDVMHKAYLSLGTDFALRFARNVTCTRIPVTREMLAKSVKWLNDQNEFYQRPGNEYRWDMYANNCAHTAHNAVAATGLLPMKKTGLSKLQHLASGGGNAAIPFNVMIRAYQALTSGGPRPGVMVYDLPIFGGPGNTYYLTDSQMHGAGFVIRDAFENGFFKWIVSLFYNDSRGSIADIKRAIAAPENQSIEANLEHNLQRARQEVSMAAYNRERLRELNDLIAGIEAALVELRNGR